MVSPEKFPRRDIPPSNLRSNHSSKKWNFNIASPGLAKPFRKNLTNPMCEFSGNQLCQLYRRITLSLIEEHSQSMAQHLTQQTAVECQLSLVHTRLTWYRSTNCPKMVSMRYLIWLITALRLGQRSAVAL
jgi:hypothetical protein